MAFIEPTSISNPEEQKWVVEINDILDDELKINVETPQVSIFRLPETITTNDPQAYMPQQIGLGPIHHFRPGPYEKMEQKKLAIVRKVLREYNIVKDGKLTIVNKVRELVPVVRSCYDMFLQGNDHESLAMIFAIDGLFLLNVFRGYNSGMEKEKEDYLVFLTDEAKTFKKTLHFQLNEFVNGNNIEEKMEVDDVNSDNKTEDIKELETEKSYSKERENQITMRKKEIKYQRNVKLAQHPLLNQPEVEVTAENKTEWEKLLHRPHHRVLKPKAGPRKRLVAQNILMVENQIPFMVLKEIDVALNSLIGTSSSQTSKGFSPYNFRSFCKVHSPLQLCSKSQAPSSVDHLLHYMYYSIVNNTPNDKKPDPPPIQPHGRDKEDDRKQKYQVRTSALVQAYNIFTRLPQKEIVQVYEQAELFLENFSKTKFILIPSASELHDKLGIKFYSQIKHRGIQDVDIRRKNMYLPCITLNSDSGVILRNLVAYEIITSTSDSFPLIEYMGLMCALILNVDDVKLLKSENVITGDLSEDEVTKLFIELSSSIPTMKTKGKSKLKEMIDEVNKDYESGVMMKTRLLLKKLARSMLVVLRAVGSFAEASWKIVVFVASIVTVFMLTSQAYCDVYGCDKKTVTMLPFASS